MSPTSARYGWWGWTAAVLAGGVGLAFALQGGYVKKHNFINQCQTCHREIPARGTPSAQIVLTDDVDRLCARCHRMPERTSHPIGVVPRSPIPLQRYLDARGRLTCVTCHEVHKEEQPLRDAKEAEGLLRGHVRGQAFCATCHEENRLGANWRHALAVPYAHSSGRLRQEARGGTVDAYSVECLSCHDGVISKQGQVDVRAGTYEHGIGISHPVGVAYPPPTLRREYVEPSQLPPTIQLFDGTVGCLSCHSLYSPIKGLLVMDNRGSALCVACHRK